MDKKSLIILTQNDQKNATFFKMPKNEAEEQVDNLLDAVTSQIVEGDRAQLLEEINR